MKHSEIVKTKFIRSCEDTHDSTNVIEFEEVVINNYRFRFSQFNHSSTNIKELEEGQDIYITLLGGITPCLTDSPQYLKDTDFTILNNKNGVTITKSLEGIGEGANNISVSINPNGGVDYAIGKENITLTDNVSKRFSELLSKMTSNI